ncbi:MAG TPA: hypothetical protein VE152_10520, partial [Acidimicrobiales bacterium]|nr:hypothetical protein [Acidimicrobiales bacterium]
MGRLSLPRRQLERCQYTTPPYRWSWPLGAIRWGRLLRARVPEVVSGPPRLGRPSGFEEGEWVRVKPAEEIRATLDATGSLRGLWFTEGQWSYCGRTFQVDRVVRRMLDDQYRMRSISRATALSGVTCQGLDGRSGCGRHCALLFRDEWLERSHP